MRISEFIKTGVTLVENHVSIGVSGPPGVGKTDAVKEIARQANAKLIVSHPVVSDPTDYKGMPAILDGEGGHTAEFLPFGDLRQLIDTDQLTIAFLDDAGQAPVGVQAALMQLVLSGQVNGHKISPNVTWIMATNRRRDQAGVTGLLAPFLDRWVSFPTIEWNMDDWVKWALANKMPPELVAFVRFRPDLVNQPGDTKDMQKSPTPRSIAGLGRLLNLGISSPEWVTGSVGLGFGTEFLAFYRTYQELPSRDEIYLNPDKVPVPQKPDVKYALMGSLAHGATSKNLEATVRYLDRCPPEFAVLCMKDMMARDVKLAKTAVFTRWCTEHKDMFGFED